MKLFAAGFKSFVVITNSNNVHVWVIIDLYAGGVREGEGRGGHKNGNCKNKQKLYFPRGSSGNRRRIQLPLCHHSLIVCSCLTLIIISITLILWLSISVHIFIISQHFNIINIITIMCKRLYVIVNKNKKKYRLLT